jgi:hypothetical protein
MPVIALVCSSVIDRAHQWSGLSPLMRLRLNADALVCQTLFLIVVAPLAGAAIGSTLFSRWVDHESVVHRLTRIVMLVVAGAGVSAAASALAALFVSGTTAGLPLLLASRATLWSAGVAFAAMGAWCASLIPDPLDAAGGSLVLALIVGAGVLVAGDASVHVPTAVIDAALLASPIVSIASAANIDILRSDLLYRLSPLAHIRFDYPTWQAACGVYIAVAFGSFAAMALHTDRTGRIMAGRTTP